MVGSYYNVVATAPDGIRVANVRTGAVLEFDHAEWEGVRADLTGTPSQTGVPSELADALRQAGLIVEDQAAERREAFHQHMELKYNTRQLHLILLPTEQCNFRCVYCYETFPRGRMPAWVRRAVVRFAESRLDNMHELRVSWFGGEPLAALNVMEEISTAIMPRCEKLGVSYRASVTTNGYLLTEAVFRKLLAWNVRHIQVTLDGPADTHDSLRVLASGKPTFAKIWSNVQRIARLADLPETFSFKIRINFTPESLPRVPALLYQLSALFQGNPRFGVFLRPVGKWGGPNDASLDVFDTVAAMEQAMTLAQDAWVHGASCADPIFEDLRPGGTACYASQPTSFIIGADATVYKCTVALYDDRNRVGALQPNGEMLLDEKKLSAWVKADGASDQECRDCVLYPSCQGEACPLIRIRQRTRPCPATKPLVEAQRLRAPAEVAAVESAATKDVT